MSLLAGTENIKVEKESSPLVFMKYAHPIKLGY
jgi:hypothetical protein